MDSYFKHPNMDADMNCEQKNHYPSRPIIKHNNNHQTIMWLMLYSTVALIMSGTVT